MTYDPCVCERDGVGDSRRLQHDFADTGHGAEAVCRVLQWKSFILQEDKTTRSRNWGSQKTI